MTIFTLLFSALLLPACAAAAFSQDLSYFDFERASLEDIINIRTGAASRLEFGAREAPGIVTVITREELLVSGARDLVDALRLVPGLDVGVDVEGLLGLGIRGNWAHEGKVLVLVDGQRYNEAFFGTPQLERVPVEQIERLEIIRGPGSVVYGGYAGLGVIKITTRDCRSLHGAAAAASLGATARGARDGRLNFAWGGHGKNGGLSAQLYLASLDKGDRRYTAFDGGSFNMKGNSPQGTRSLNLGFYYGGFGGRLIADQHRTRQRDHFDDSILPRPYARNFDAYFAEARYDFRPVEALTLTPALNYSWQEPYSGYDPVEYPREKSARYLKGTLTAVYAAAEQFRLSGGAEYSQDRGKLDARTPAMWYFKGGRTSVQYDNSAVFAEAVAELGAGTFSAGARYDRHQKFAPAFSPRLVWAKVLDTWHLKAIYSRAFRAPGMDNLEIDAELDPERTEVAELEAGFSPGEDLYISANVFDMHIQDPIVFYVDGTGQHYGNYRQTGTRGAELTARLKKAWGHAALGWSHYAAHANKVDFYNSGGSGALLAFARNKFTLSSSLKVPGSLSVSPTAVYYSGRRGYGAPGATRRFDDALLADLYFSRSGLLGGKLEAGFGVYNLFNTPFSYLQPYNGGHAPLPALSREFRLRTSYKF